MTMKKLLLAAALPILLGGCYVAGRGTVAYAEAPPPPRYVVVDARPGYVWVDGHWYWGANSWAWSDGYYIVDRPGYVWVQGSYYGRRYRPGYWNHGSGGTYYAPRGSSQAGQVVRGGVRTVQPSRAGQYTAPARTTAPVRSVAPSRGNGGGRVRVRDHR